MPDPQKQDSGDPKLSFEERVYRWVVGGIFGLVGAILAVWGLIAWIGVGGLVTLLILAGLGTVAVVGLRAYVKAQQNTSPGTQSHPGASSSQARSRRRFDKRGPGPRPPAQPTFFGANEPLQLNLGRCPSPLTYVHENRLNTAWDPSLIELGLHVDAQKASQASDLPYWPSYRAASPAQRAVYQTWLIGKRQDPGVAIGYVFIFFYGLERRILCDHRDHAAIGTELIRLLSIYGEQSHSFRRYATRFLWHVVRLGMDDGTVQHKVLPHAMRLPGRWDDDTLALCLSVLYDLEMPVPTSLALRLAESDHRTTNSVVVRRNREVFERLFKQRYEEAHSDGLMLKASKRPTRVRHQPASAALAQDPDIQLEDEIPNCPAITSQFKPLVRIWDACIEELRGYDKVKRQSDSESLSAEMYEQLPEELREGDHPDFDNWWKIKEDHTDESGRSVVPISALAEAKGIEPRPKLTLTQAKQILASAEAMGFGIEPDARITRRPYRWEEPVCLFISQHDERPSGRYLAATTLLRLGMVVAEADGVIQEEELAHITDHLEQQLDLSDPESERLEQLKYLLTQEGARYELLTKGLIDSLSKAQRTAVGGYLVNVAAADGVVTEAEHKALKKVYRRLGLDENQLYELVYETAPEDGPVEVQAERLGREGEPIPPHRDEGLTINRDRLRDIQQQTAEVASILTNAMAVEDENEAEQTKTINPPDFSEQPDKPTSGVQFRPAHNNAPGVATVRPDPDEDEASEVDLDERLRPFLDAIIAREQWSKEELRAIADQHNLMLAGAIDGVNEWAEERFGDRLIEEDGDTFYVDKSLMETNQ